MSNRYAWFMIFGVAPSLAAAALLFPEAMASRAANVIAFGFLGASLALWWAYPLGPRSMLRAWGLVK